MIKANEQIPDLVVGTLDGLGRLCALLEAQDRPSQSCAQSYLARFKLWAGSLGAHRTSGTRSLEYRLRDASSIRKHLVSLLQELRDLVVEEGMHSTLQSVLRQAGVISSTDAVQHLLLCNSVLGPRSERSLEATPWMTN